jgi:hypothetical protein
MRPTAPDLQAAVCAPPSIFQKKIAERHVAGGKFRKECEEERTYRQNEDGPDSTEKSKIHFGLLMGNKLALPIADQSLSPGNSPRPESIYFTKSPG